MNSEDEFVQVPRGVICTNYKKQSSGEKIINKKKKDAGSEQQPT